MGAVNLPEPIRRGIPSQPWPCAYPHGAAKLSARARSAPRTAERSKASRFARSGIDARRISARMSRAHSATRSKSAAANDSSTTTTSGRVTRIRSTAQMSYPRKRSRRFVGKAVVRAHHHQAGDWLEDRGCHRLASDDDVLGGESTSPSSIGV
jgi:hypothetical protein